MKKFVLIKLVVQRSNGGKAIDAALASGATGVTYYYGSGTGVRQRLGFWGRLIESEKMIIEIVCEQEKATSILKALDEKCQINKPGVGFAYVCPVEAVAGYFEADKK